MQDLQLHLRGRLGVVNLHQLIDDRVALLLGEPVDRAHAHLHVVAGARDFE